MANNRLWIEDTETRERILLAKSLGGGWDVRLDADELARWLDLRDTYAAFGSAQGKTTLRLVAENDPE